VPGVQDIEAPVGEDDFLPLAAQLGKEGAYRTPGNYLFGRVFR
jgi:hypothetical protein